MKLVLPIIGLLLLSACGVPESSVRSSDGSLKEICYNGVRCIVFRDAYAKAGGISCDFSSSCDVAPPSHGL